MCFCSWTAVFQGTYPFHLHSKMYCINFFLILSYYTFNICESWYPSSSLFLILVICFFSFILKIEFLNLFKVPTFGFIYLFIMFPFSILVISALVLFPLVLFHTSFEFNLVFCYCCCCFNFFRQTFRLFIWGFHYYLIWTFNVTFPSDRFFLFWNDIFHI